MTDKKVITFSLLDVKEKPARAYKKGSKFDEIFTQFFASKKDLVKITIPKMKSNYLRTQLNKRIQANNLKLKVSVVNDECYLEKEKIVNLKV